MTPLHHHITASGDNDRDEQLLARSAVASVSGRGYHHPCDGVSDTTPDPDVGYTGNRSSKKKNAAGRPETTGIPANHGREGASPVTNWGVFAACFYVRAVAAAWPADPPGCRRRHRRATSGRAAAATSRAAGSGTGVSWRPDST